MNSFALVAREVSMHGTVICGVEEGNRLAVIGYHLYCEDEQKNPHHLVIRDGVGGTVLVCVPTTLTPAPVPVFFSSPLYLSADKALVLSIIDEPKVRPAKVWGTLWVQ